MPRPCPGSDDGIGLVVALPAEAHSIGARRLRPGDCVRWHDGWIAVSGIGLQNGRRAAERLLGCGVKRLANWGVAGALAEDFVSGDVLIPECVRSADDAPGFATDPDARARLVAALGTTLRVRCGTLWSAAEPVASAADKRALARHSQAVAVDMEAAAVAAVATGAGLPFTAVKAICDPVARELPATVLAAMDGAADGVSLRMFAAIALGGPAAWGATRRLARDFARARHALATAAALAA